MKLKRTLGGLGVIALVGLGTQFIGSTAASAHTAALSGTAECQTDGTYSIHWSGTTSDVPADQLGRVKVTSFTGGGTIQGKVSGVVPNQVADGLARNAPYTFDQIGVAGDATSAVANVNVHWTPDGYDVMAKGTVALLGTCTAPPPPPTVSDCTTITAGGQIDQDTAKVDSDTRSGGTETFTADGVHIVTASNTSNDKVASYYGLSIPLGQAGAPVMDEVNNSGGKAGLQLGLDIDGNGTWDGYLVSEPDSYGAGQWWTNKTTFGVHPGGGYPSMGTLTEYLQANPNAKIVSFGYSLGSGVQGDDLIKSITVGCKVYTFTYTAPPPPVDVCPNIDGAQTTVPDGYQLVDGQCVVIPPPPVDVCTNLDGLQVTIPDGYQLVDGLCVVIPPPPVDICPNIDGLQTVVPDGDTLVDGQCVTTPPSSEPPSSTPPASTTPPDNSGSPTPDQSTDTIVPVANSTPLANTGASHVMGLLEFALVVVIGGIGLTIVARRRKHSH